MKYKKKDIFDTQSTPEIFYYDFITLMSLLAASVSGSNVPNLGMNSANSDIWPICIDLWRHVWHNMSDIFWIINIPEMFYYHVVTLTSSLVTLVTSDVTQSKYIFGGL